MHKTIESTPAAAPGVLHDVVGLRTVSLLTAKIVVSIWQSILCALQLVWAPVVPVHPPVNVRAHILVGFVILVETYDRDSVVNLLVIMEALIVLQFVEDARLIVAETIAISANESSQGSFLQLLLDVYSASADNAPVFWMRDHPVSIVSAFHVLTIVRVAVVRLRALIFRVLPVSSGSPGPRFAIYIPDAVQRLLL